jgi:hypothetical protein
MRERKETAARIFPIETRHVFIFLKVCYELAKDSEREREREKEQEGEIARFREREIQKERDSEREREGERAMHVSVTWQNEMAA